MKKEHFLTDCHYLGSCRSKKTFFFIFNFKSHPQYVEYVADLRWAPLVLVLMIYAGAQMGFDPIIKVFIKKHNFSF